MKKTTFYLLAVIFVISLLSACKKPILFGINQQKELGKQVRDQILADPQNYPILPETQYPQAYRHIRRITQNILNSGKVELKNQFDWEVRIIRDDKTLNAFCTPGGYIFVLIGKCVSSEMTKRSMPFVRPAGIFLSIQV